MATILVGYLYKKYKARNSTDDQTAASSPSRSIQQAPSTEGNVAAISTPFGENLPIDSRNTKSGLKWKLTLMAALLIPIFLETLDYTGEWFCFECLDREITAIGFLVVATAQPHIAVRSLFLFFAPLMANVPAQLAVYI